MIGWENKNKNKKKRKNKEEEINKLEYSINFIKYFIWFLILLKY